MMETSAAVEHTAITSQLTRLWAGILGKEVGPDDDFFDAGGSSLAGIKMIIDVQSLYHLELDIESFFEYPTISRLAAAIRQRQTAATEGVRHIEPHQVP
jgi:acyl carrier protein